MAAPPNLAAHKPHWHRDEAWKQPVRCATTVAGTLASSFENGDSAGGMTLATGDRILIKDQAAGAENGIYRVNATGAPTRDFDMDVAAEFVGAMVYVVAGTLSGTTFRCTNATAPTIGATAIAFALAGVTDHGALSGLTDDDHTQYVLKRSGGKEVVSTVAASGATETLDLADGNVHDVTLTADCTLTFAGATNGVACSFTLLLRQDGTGGWTTTWPVSVEWPDGAAPTLDETASTVSVLTFFSLDGGTVWYGFATGSSGAPTTVDYLVGTASGALSAEIAVGTTPGGELGGTWASPTVDGTHAGSAHLALGSSSSTAAAGDHTHALSGQILVIDTPSTPLVFADLLTTEDEHDLLYADV